MHIDRLSPRFWTFCTVFIFCTVVFVSVFENRPLAFVLDDAYITLGNAEIISSGAVDGFGNSSPTGATSPFHLITLWLLSGAINVTTASFSLLILFAAIYAVGLWKVVFTITGSQMVASAFTVFGFTVSRAWPTLLNGLETGMAMAAVTWALWALLNKRDVILAGIAGALPFIRPELAVLSLLLAAPTSARLWHDKKKLTYVILVGATVAGILALSTITLTGELISSTSAAKRAFFDTPPLLYSSRLVLSVLLVLISPFSWVLVGLVCLFFLRGVWVFPAFFFVFIAVTAYQLPNALMHNNFRYLYPFLPLGLAGWAVLYRNRPRLHPLSILLFGSLLLFPSGGWEGYRGSIEFSRGQEEVYQWVKTNLPNGARVLLHDAGYIPWRLMSEESNVFSLQLVDVVGLKTPEVIQVHQDITFASHGENLGVAVGQIATSSEAEYAIILDRPFWGDIKSHLVQAGFSVEKIFENKESYQVFRISAPTS